MAIILDDKLLLLTPPKTGSQWIRASLKHVSGSAEMTGKSHVNGHGDLSFYGTGHCFLACFVRKPEDWLESYWFYREWRQSWDNRWSLDRLCGLQAQGDLARFLDLYEENCKGYVSNMFRNYTHMGHVKINFVGHQENLCGDFLRLLSICGIRSDTRQIKAMGPINVGSNKIMSVKQKERVREMEAWSYMEYGYN